MIGIIAFISIFIFAYQAYKSAVRYDKNAIGWALAVFGVGFCIQLLVPFFIGVAVGIYYVANGMDPNEITRSFTGIFTVLGIASVIGSIVAMMFMLRKISTVTDDAEVVDEPPPPTDFDLS